MVEVVVDASMLIALSQINRRLLLRDLFDRVIVPLAVQVEVQRTVSPWPTWVDVQAPLATGDRLPFAASLDPGETKAIPLAIDTSAPLVALDDLPARRVAMTHGLQVVGTADILVMAKRRGLIASVREDLDELRALRFRLRQDVCLEVLRAAGETSGE